MTIQEYIDKQREGIRPRLKEVYASIKSAIPEAEERISWDMPNFWKGRQLIFFAAFKHHIGIYPGAEAVVVFAERLKDYETSKGTIRIPDDKPLPLDLIAEIARWCYEHNSK